MLHPSFYFHNNLIHSNVPGHHHPMNHTILSKPCNFLQTLYTNTRPKFGTIAEINWLHLQLRLLSIMASSTVSTALPTQDGSARNSTPQTLQVYSFLFCFFPPSVRFCLMGMFWDWFGVNPFGICWRFNFSFLVKFELCCDPNEPGMVKYLWPYVTEFFKSRKSERAVVNYRSI